ncbi:MAG: tRNA adenosine(34) deaminase TadA [Firmicutes bacterium]|nr:tRNA adenosine(34) deaminase TadA [Bacillota bacterium]
MSEGVQDGAVRHSVYMEEALLEAKKAAAIGEVPIGAVVVRADGEIIGRGYNQRETLKDPTAHAEVLALREAALVYGDWRLTGCRLYVTVEPCVMCAGAILLARVEEVVFGTLSPKGGALVSTLSLYDIQGFNHYPRVCAGILDDRCAMMLADFFSKRRRDKR